MSNTINIGRKDVMWNYAATFLQIGVGVILLPFILRVFPQETVAIWTIFSTIIALAGLLDFGFNPSFARNVSYVVSGVKELKANGYNIVESHNSEIDYSLFKGLINAMKWFYARAAAILFALLATAGTYYMHTVLKTYSGDHAEVYIAWAILVAINSYSLYTMYYDSLMQGKGLIKRSKQIKIVGQSAYLIVAVVLILLRFNLIAVVSAQALSILIIRILSYRTIYTPGFRQCLQGVKAQAREKILKPIYPNAVKLGLNNFVGFFVLRSLVLIGALFFSLNEMASYGITMQIAGIISSVANVYFFTYLPKAAQQRIQNDDAGIKRHYLKSSLLMLSTFFALGLFFALGGEWVLHLIKSQTPLLPKSYIVIILAIALHDAHVCIAANTVLTKNEMPYLNTTLFISALTLILFFTFTQLTHWGVLSMIIAPGVATLLHWYWMLGVVKELKIRKADVYYTFQNVKIFSKHI
jgi:O-antigen/teichoic acid export membrane protein